MMTDDVLKQLKIGLGQLALKLSDVQIQQLMEFLLFLTKWNKAYNLTAIRDPNDMVSHHLLDSLSIVPYLVGEKIVDVGAGAGLPGIPLAIYYPDRQFVLIDSVGKKTRFINQAARHLGLTNVEAIHDRAEKYPTSQCFDTMTARAVGSMEYLLPIAQHLLKSTGQLLAMKSDLSDQAMAEIPSLATTVTLTVPGVSTKRSLIICKMDK